MKLFKLYNETRTLIADNIDHFGVATDIVFDDGYTGTWLLVDKTDKEFVFTGAVDGFAWMEVIRDTLFPA